MKTIDFTARKKAADRAAHKALVLNAWDRLFPKDRAAQQVGKQSRLDVNPEVRRKAKEAL